MRVLYLTDRLSLRGGADQHLLQVVTAAAAVGYEVTVAAGRIDAEVELPRSVTTRRLKGLASSVASAAKLGGLQRLIDEAELIHLQNVMNPAALELTRDHRRRVVTVQDHRIFCPGPGKTLPDGSPCQRRFEESSCRQCLPDAAYCARLCELTQRRLDALRGARPIVLSNYMAEQLALVELEDAAVIPPWIATSTERAQPGNGFLLGGRLVAHKGLDVALRAWKLCGLEEPLRVAGSGRLAATLEGADLLGWLTNEELRSELRRARALLFPSHWQEPFGILGVEALAEATPVILTAGGGTSDWSHRGCIVVPPGDAEAMSRAMNDLAHDSERATRLGEEGRRMVTERFAREGVERRLLTLYEELI